MISLSDAEWKLMNVLWESKGSTITQLVAILKEDTAWSKHTIISMLMRLETKGAVLHRQSGRAKQFYTVIQREQTQLRETKSFLGRLYDGSLGLMLNAMLGNNELSKEEIDELREILKKAEENYNA